MKSLLFLLFVIASLTAGGAAPPKDSGARLEILAPDESFVRDAAGQRVLVFGEEPEKIHFQGRIHGRLPGHAKYFWTFKGGTPDRFPAQGVSSRVGAPIVEFKGAGEAALHAVDGDDISQALAEATLPVHHLVFQFRNQNEETKEADSAYSYIPDNITSNTHGDLPVCADVTIHTEPSLPGIDLGNLGFEKPGDRAIPKRVITDANGEFRTKLFGWVGNGKDSQWNLTLDLEQRTRDPNELAQIIRQNEQLRNQDAAKNVGLVARRVTLYKVSVDSKDGAVPEVDSIDAYEFQPPRIPGTGKMEEMRDDWYNDELCFYFRTPGKPDYLTRVNARFGKDLREATTAFVPNDFATYMWYHEWNHWQAEDGQYYLQIPVVKNVVYRGAEHETVEAVTLHPRNGLLQVLVRQNGVAKLLEIEAATGQVRNSRLCRSAECQRLLWVSDRYLLGATYGRKGGNYQVIDLKSGKIVAGGGSEAASYTVRDGCLYSSAASGSPARKLFRFTKKPD